MPVGPMPVGPMLLGPLLVFVVAGMCRSCFGVVMAYSCFFGWGDVSGVFFWRLGVFFAQARLDVESFSLAFARCLAPSGFVEAWTRLPYNGSVLVAVRLIVCGRCLSAP